MKKKIDDVTKMLDNLYKDCISTSYDSSIKSLNFNMKKNPLKRESKDVVESRKFIEMTDKNSINVNVEIFKPEFDYEDDLDLDIMEKEYYEQLSEKIKFIRIVNGEIKLNTTVFSNGTENEAMFCEHKTSKYVFKVPLKQYKVKKNHEFQLKKDFLKIHIAKEILKIFNSKIESFVENKSNMFNYADTFMGKIDEIKTPEYMNGNVFFLIEEYIPEFTKFNNNAGKINSSNSKLNEMVQAFSHFSFDYSNGNLLICDIQGNKTITDIAIHSKSGVFEDLDHSIMGFQSFFLTHKCNFFCKKLKLEDMRAIKEDNEKIVEEPEDEDE